MSNHLSPRDARLRAALRVCRCGTRDPFFDGHSEDCPGRIIAEPGFKRLLNATERLFTAAEDAQNKGLGNAASFLLNLYLRADAELKPWICEGCGQLDARLQTSLAILRGASTMTVRWCEHCIETVFSKGCEGGEVEEIITRVD